MQERRRSGEQQLQPTFLENMQALNQLKEEALRLHFLYSNEAVNVNQLNELGQLRRQLRDSQERLESYRKQYTSDLQQLEQTCSKLQRENKELFELNHSLVQANEKLADNLNQQNEKLTSANERLEAEVHRCQQLERQHQKQLDNVKLMHAQQLYILKKRK